MADSFRFADALGPDKMVEIYDARAGLKAVVAIDNVSCGPAIGGVRMAPDVSAEEAFRLARAMTMKNAAAGLRHGGGKSVIVGDPDMSMADKERVVRAFAVAIRDLTDYIPGPDMGTDETCMAWIQDEIGRSVGLPPEIGGIPLDVIGATGYGLAITAEVAEQFCDVRIKGARVAVQGFGSVGKHVARFLAERGAVLVAASDSHGTVHDPDGLDVAALIAHKDSGRPVAEYGGGSKDDAKAIIGVPCDIWIPAARPDVIRADNVDRLDTKLILQGANIPITGDAESALAKKGVLIVPDFIANAGGVICAAVEYHGGTRDSAFRTIEEKIRANTEAVLTEARNAGILPRQAAVALAERRVRAAMGYRRTF